MQELLQSLHNLLISGQDALFVSILGESGSAPRGTGAHMLVSKSGRLLGSIGGGALEYQAEKLAKTLLRERRSLLKKYHLSNDLGMICGGEAMVFYQYIAAESPVKELCASALLQMGLERNIWLITQLVEGKEWQMGLFSHEEGLSFLCLDMTYLQHSFRRTPSSLQMGEVLFFIEPIMSAGRVLIFGGGHVAQALTPLLAKLDFVCWVMDDRREFATIELFSKAKRVICGSYKDIGKHIKIKPEDYVVVMTHAHAFDYVVQKQAMLSSPAYIGVIGSKNKVKTISERLLADGFSPEEIVCVYAPIGLPIKAETPMEIAVSIAAQLVQIRAERADN
jgi:xanthine dehydrogenase accessory factor